PGDVVLIGNGRYEGDPKATGPDTALLSIDVSGRPDAWITWKARPGHKPELHPRQWSGIEIHGSYHVIEGLTLIGGNDEVSLIEAIEAAKKNPKLARYNTNGIFVEGRRNAPSAKPHHVTIRGNSVSKMPGGGIVAIEADHITIEDNQVFENAWYMEYGGSGITFLNNWQFDDAPGYHIIVRRNRVWNNKTMVPWNTTGKLSDGNGILLDVTDQTAAGGATNPNGDAVVSVDKPAAAKPKRPIWTARALIANNLSAFNGGSGIHTFRTSHVDIVHNTTYWNGSVVNYEELFANRSTDIVILNNIIVPRPGGRVTSNNRNTAVRWDYNLYPVAQSVVSGPNDIVADPRFILIDRDLRRANFGVARNSPARGSATSELAQPTDLRGVRRSPRGGVRGAIVGS
ncbi:MAG TPA: right-handed parallel beta-helix repeat-containing protein, partial [Sphingomonas sp.]